jgi:hypothetical protein
MNGNVRVDRKRGRKGNGSIQQHLRKRTDLTDKKKIKLGRTLPNLKWAEPIA